MNLQIQSEKIYFIGDKTSSDSILIVNFKGFLENPNLLNKILKDLVYQRALNKSFIAIVPGLQIIREELSQVCREIKSREFKGEVVEIIRDIKEVHLGLIRNLGLSVNSQKSLRKRLNILSLFLKEDLELLDLGYKNEDKIMSRGSWFSAIIISEILEEHAIKAKIVDSAQFMKVDKLSQNLYQELTADKIAEEVVPLLDREIIPVIADFAGSTDDGKYVSLNSKEENTIIILERFFSSWEN